MSRTPPYYISIESKLSATFTFRILGVFSTPALAVASVAKITPCYVRVPNSSAQCIMRYVGIDNAIKIVPQHSDMVGAFANPANTVFLAIDECDNNIVDTRILGMAHDAWAACEAMKRKCGDYWKDEKEWNDNNGCKHGEAEFNITTSSTPTEVGDHASQQLAGLRTTGMFKHHWYVKEVVIVEPRYLVQV